MPPLDPPLDPIEERHKDRARAESFGAVADQYDRYRPEYAPALMDALAALRPATTLDIGCGTGRVAGALAARGLAVVGVEPDERMAALARSRGVPVEVATFEGWDDRGRQFDLVTCGNAWHWVSPAAGFAKLARVVAPRGNFALFWAVDNLDEATAAALEPAYRRCAPALRVAGAPVAPALIEAARDETLAGLAGSFKVESREFPAARTLSGEEWASVIATVSDHQRLRPAQLADLQQAVREVIARLGGQVTSRCPSYLWLARRG